MKSKITQDKTIIKAGTTTAGATNTQVSPVGETFKNDDKKSRLEQCEKIIEQNEQGLFSTGRNLKIINAQDLYKTAGYTAFDAYCRERWGMSDKHAYRLIGAADCYDVLAKRTTEKGWVLPKNEAQIRELATLPEKDWERTWEKFLKKISGKTFTAEDVETFINGGEEQKKVSPKKSSNVENDSADDAGSESPATTLQSKLDQIDDLVTSALKEAADDGVISIEQYRELLEEIKNLIEDTE